MKPSEALKVLSLVEATWPGRPLPDETKAVWGKALVAYEFDDAFSAVEWLGKLAKFPASLEEIVSGTVEERNERLQRERKVLPPAQYVPGETCSFGEFLRTHPDMEARLRALDTRPPKWMTPAQAARWAGRSVVSDWIDLVKAES